MGNKCTVSIPRSQQGTASSNRELGPATFQFLTHLSVIEESPPQVSGNEIVDTS